MSSSDTGSITSLTEKSARGISLDTTRSNVMRLIARQAVLADQVPESDDSTDTLGVMLRLGPEPMVLLMMDDISMRTRIAAMLTQMSFEFVQSTASHAVLEMPVGAPAILLTDDLGLIRSVRADRLQPHIQSLFLESDAQASLATAIQAGADDAICLNADRNVLRARLLVASRYAHLEASFRALLRENRELSTIDVQTRVANRRFFDRHFPLEINRAERNRHPMSLIMCDIDHFKVINDTFGHAAGDEVLREFGSRLQQGLRQGADWVARVGGEEFAIVLPETGIAAAAQVAHKLREQIRTKLFQMKAGSIAVTASFGVCELLAVTTGELGIAERVQATADEALCRSKRDGRDRVTAVSLDVIVAGTRTAT